MKYIPTIIAAVTAVATVFAPTVQSDLAAHPEATAVVAAVYAIIAHFLPSPAASVKQ